MVGRVSSAALTLFALPIVVKLIGIESYGIIGIFASIQAVFGLLDLGLSMTMMREMARGGVDPAQAQRTRDLIRTLEVIYWSIGIVIAVISVLIAPLLATRWLNAENLSAATIQQSIVLMGFVIACQWPISLYEGGITGLQRQVINNAVNLSATIVRTLGAILVLLFVSRTVQAYLIAQGLTYAIHTLVMRRVLLTSAPRSDARAHFRPAIVRELWRFAGAVNINSALGMVLTQADKLILATILPLRLVGYYAIATAAAGSLYYIIGPLFTAISPQLTQYVAVGDEERLTALYHRGCQMVAVCVFPTAIVLALFAHPVLLLWTRDAEVAAGAALAASLLTMGTMLHAAMHLPYALQLAYGWTSLTMAANVVFAATLPIATYFLAIRYGLPGAATVWVTLNLLYVTAVVPAMHRRILRNEQAAWYRDDIFLPLAGAVLGAVIWWFVLPAKASPVLAVSIIAAAGATSLFLAALTTPVTRQVIARTLSRSNGAYLHR